ncbi:MAG: hypothetical protein Q8Q79_06915 [Sphingopyxis sp.]|nr:hypothetical protein [Sphingopyxis sp.]
MDDNHWIWPDRRDLYHACATFADPAASDDRVGEAADALLNDLELYDDPRQGHGSWLFPDELTIADNLATKLHLATADEPMENWGKVLLRHPLWCDIRSDAKELHGLILRNGQGSLNNVS